MKPEETMSFSKNQYNAEWRGENILVTEMINPPELVFAIVKGRSIFIKKDELNMSLPPILSDAEKFAEEHGLKVSFWQNILVDIPKPGEGKEFYLRFDALGKKHFIDIEKKEILIEWMKLTEKLIEF